MSAPSVTWTFTNGTTSDGTQVNTNFTDLINGASDGTKDYSIGTLTVAGAATFNGSIALGNAGADDITFTGSVASTIPIKANATYNLGSSTSALLSVYLGNGTKSTRLLAGTVANSYTITFPDDVPAVTGKTIIVDTGGVLSFRYADKFTASKTTTYAATGDETVIPCDATSAGFTVNLPAAASYTGKQLKIIKTDSTTGIVTIDGNASETINGSLTTTLNTQYEAVTIACDGSNWFIVHRNIPSAWASSAFTFDNSTSNTNSTIMARRIGDSLHVRGSYQAGTVSAAAWAAVIPNSWTIDTAKLNTNANGIQVGTASVVNGGGVTFAGGTGGPFPIWFDGSTATKLFASVAGATHAFTKVNAATITATTNLLSFEFSIPISGWNS
jgi:hypothetical protein